MKNKKRLDSILVELYAHYSRTQLQSWVIQGKVFVDDQKIVKPGTQVAEDSKVILTAEQPKYVSRAGWKIEKALEHFDLDVTDFTVLDAGLSTGGFADCLLQKGAKKIYGIDVGHSQAHEQIRQDERVVVLERVNLRDYKHEGDSIDLVTLDLSFISLLKVMDTVKAVLEPGKHLIALIKPQFEAEPGNVPKGGVITDSKLHKKLVDSVVQQVKEEGFEFRGVIESPILGTAGNKEFLAYFIRF